MFKGSKILITGGTGSWGYALTQRLLSYGPQEIRIFSRNEYKQVQMQRDFDNNPVLNFIIGDVRDYQAVLDALKNVDYVFHLAALKHVPICEFQPKEALKTNVSGTENVIGASIAQGVKKVIDVSTDKAVDPVNFYGMTKAYGEKLMLHANTLSDTTRFVCIRGGNVLGTQGSVVPFFKKLILEQKDLPLTSNQMTRFFLTISEAIDLLLEASVAAVGGETFVMKMKACRISDLAQVLIKHFASGSIQIKEVGVRPGEKLHEVLVSSYEAPRTYIFRKDYYVILPQQQSSLYDVYKNLEKVKFECYGSNDLLMSASGIEEMLRIGGFIS
jgi:FlaA1/EpsC-like NDP-sugar epimerase